MSNRRREFGDRRNLPGACEARLRAAERVLSALSIVDIGEQGVPTDHAAFCVPHGGSPRVEPTMDTIAATQAKFNVIRLPGFCGRFPAPEDARTIISVDEVAPLIERQCLCSQECEETLIHELYVTVGIHRIDHGRNGLEDEAQLPFAL